MARERSFSILTVFMLHCLILPSVLASISNITTDQYALLALKARITHDPSNLLANNWSSNTPVCHWMGVTCGVRHGRVTALDISYFNLTGTIPPQLGNLSFLAFLAIRNNSFYGSLPDALVQLRRLKYIDFLFNNFNIEIPSWFGSLSKLQRLYLTDNNFVGTIPPSLGNISCLQQLYLNFNQLSGPIPKEIGNLTKLNRIYLGYNRLKGEIPQELGNLAELEQLSLRSSLLTGPIPSLIFNISSLIYLNVEMNNLAGSLPDNICQRLAILEVIYLQSNKLRGPIPDSLWECRELRDVRLSNNQFTGSVSRNIGNLTLANAIDLSSNHLEGQIPSEVGNLPNLMTLMIQANNLAGPVPATIFNISTMTELSLVGNHLSGSIPSSIDPGLPNLERLYLAMNDFNGTIPSSITNMSKLIELELSVNSFSGFIPNEIGNLRNLELLNFFDNYLMSTPDLSFLSSLTNCKNLRALQTSENPLNGALPNSIGNLSLPLEKLSMRKCNITGNIPEEIGRLRNLMVLGLGSNELFGPIPVALGRLRKLQGLYLEGNKLEGFIPNHICHLDNLVELELQGNKLFGSIPACLGNLTSLRELSLDSNRLTSTIPSSLWNLEGLLRFNLSSNSLHGPLPVNIENLKAVIEIDLSMNQLSGYVPAGISALGLEFLSLRHNRLKGPIPESIGNLISLKSLDLSNNELSGVIPKSLEKLSLLQQLNLSFNRLEGEIPAGGPFRNFSAESFMRNHGLCGSFRLQVPKCKTSTKRKSRIKTIMLLIILPASVAFIILLLALKLVLLRCRKKAELPNDGDFSRQEMWRRISYYELLRSTDGFGESNLLGVGSFGSVYYGRLTDGLEIAVKVFHLQLEGAFKSFDDECRLMSCIRHRNLVKVISNCSNNDFKALVLEYMPNGSLEKYLYSDNFFLDISMSLNIMIDVASALEYLHFGYSPPIIHCDLKPSNVLLDESMVAHLSDFGIAKLLGEGESMTQTQTLATIGYMATEYGREGKVSRKGDVYSYGIMLMETFTNKKPTDEIFCGEMSLKIWVSEALRRSVIEVVDTNLLRREDEHFAGKEQCISSILNLAMACTREQPEERINMKDVVTQLLKIRVKLLSNTGNERR